MEVFSTQPLSLLIETYVDSSRSSSVQSTSLNEIVALLKAGKITLQSLVIELEMYLTTTDDILRARGTLLLGETLTAISTMPVEETIIHSLILFFTERLADWRALRGALVGCLALMKRGSKGIIIKEDTKALAISFFDNLQVQSLAQFDRKLCFELLECLLQHYSDAVQPLGEQLVRGIYEAIYEEKDPQCLIIVFHIVEVLAELFPDPGWPISSIASDLFSVIGCYFPIHFTHTAAETADVARDDLSKSLMLAFSCTPLFEPYAIPLLLEKLSSSLPLAKIESLKFLTHCSVAYGYKRMSKHAAAIWLSLKEILIASGSSEFSSFTPEHLEESHPNENETVREALLLLETVIKQNTKLILDLIVNDEMVDEVLADVDQYSSYIDIPMDVRSKYQVVSWVIFVSSKVSFTAVNVIAARFLSHLLKFIDSFTGNDTVSRRAPFDSLFLCVEFLRALKMSIANHLPSANISSEDVSCLLQRFPALFTIFNSILSNVTLETEDGAIFLAVKGMSILATSPQEYAHQTNLIYQQILMSLTEAITSVNGKPYIRKLALQALTNIGLFVYDLSDIEKKNLFINFFIKRIVSSSDVSMPFPLKMEAWTKISSCGIHYLLIISESVQEIIYSQLNNLFIHENMKMSSELVLVLNFYCDFFIPRIQQDGSLVESLFHLVLSLWDQIERCKIYTCRLQDEEFLDALTKFIKVAVSSFSIESQNEILSKAYASLPNDDASNNHWILKFFASIIIPLRPLTQLPNLTNLLRLLIAPPSKYSLIPSCALGSILNKLSNSDDLLEATEIVLSSYTKAIRETWQPDAVTALAWVAKGLLMRGHERVKEAIMLFFEILSNSSFESAMRSAADAFQILMSESDLCLNRRFHAVSRPLYKQRLFSSVMPIFYSLLIKSQPQSTSRSMLLRGFSHIICDSPLSAVSRDSNKLIPFLFEALTSLSGVSSDKDIVYGLALVLSGLLTDRSGQNNVLENLRTIVEGLLELISYPHMMAVRETAIQCLATMSTLPHASVYRFRHQILNATCKALDDPKRAVRLEAVKCRNLWSVRVT